LYKSNELRRPIRSHCLFVINDSQRWTFSEYRTHDGVCVITKWIDALDDDVQAELEARFLQWAANDKWIDLYGETVGIVGLDIYGDRFEELTRTRDIAVTVKSVLYRILGVHFSLWEFVMLVGYADPERRSKAPQEIEKSFNELLNDLRQNRHHRQKYELE
jgi:hypothetical protein